MNEEKTNPIFKFLKTRPQWQLLIFYVLIGVGIYFLINTYVFKYIDNRPPKYTHPSGDTELGPDPGIKWPEVKR